MRLEELSTDYELRMNTARFREKDKAEASRPINAITPSTELAISPSLSDEYQGAPPPPDPETVERFCRVWAEVGRAILIRRSK